MGKVSDLEPEAKQPISWEGSVFTGWSSMTLGVWQPEICELPRGSEKGTCHSPGTPASEVSNSHRSAPSRGLTIYFRDERGCSKWVWPGS